MATQFHFAYSSEVKGVGIFAGGPYYCAMGDMMKALLDCMGQPGLIDTSALEKKISDFESKKYIDPVSNIKDSKVYIFSGTKDKTVMKLVDQKGEEVYKKYGANIKTEYTQPAGHTQPTNDPSNGDCGSTASPFIGYCKYDGAFQALSHISS